MSGSHLLSNLLRLFYEIENMGLADHVAECNIFGSFSIRKRIEKFVFLTLNKHIDNLQINQKRIPTMIYLQYLSQGTNYNIGSLWKSNIME